MGIYVNVSQHYHVKLALNFQIIQILTIRKPTEKDKNFTPAKEFHLCIRQPQR